MGGSGEYPGSGHGDDKSWGIIISQFSCGRGGETGESLVHTAPKYTRTQNSNPA